MSTPGAVRGEALGRDVNGGGSKVWMVFGYELPNRCQMRLAAIHGRLPPAVMMRLIAVAARIAS
jgi:hypothetical protein